MKSSEIASRTVLIALLVALAVASRLIKDVIPWLPPNFHAVAGTALFAGFLFRSRALALIVPLAAMWISDQILGGYDRVVMVAVYSSLALPIVAGRWLERRTTPSRVAGAAVLSSVVFFLVTNLAVWAVWYPHSIDGLSRCFLRALPFFSYTLTGDLLFACGLFSLYHLVIGAVRQRNATAVGFTAAVPIQA
jgi:hypothetical protein